MIGTLSLFLALGGGFVAEEPPANVYPIATIQAWALDAQSLAGQQAEARRQQTGPVLTATRRVATAATTDRALAPSSPDAPYAGLEQPIFGATPDGFPIRWRLSADAVRFVLAQSGVVRVELVPIFDAQKNRSSVAVVGIKADGTQAPMAADGAMSCPPYCIVDPTTPADPAQGK